MKEHCRNATCHRAVDEAPHGRSLGLTVESPPKDNGPEPLYRVVYVIDVNAMNVRQAAERAYAIVTDPASMPPVLDILDVQGRRTRVDLSDT